MTKEKAETKLRARIEKMSPEQRKQEIERADKAAKQARSHLRRLQKVCDEVIHGKKAAARAAKKTAKANTKNDSAAE
jgi:hypothetical protein